MSNWKGTILGGKGYHRTEVSFSGPSTQRTAEAHLRSLYPGAVLGNVYRNDCGRIDENARESIRRSGSFF